MSNQKSCCVRIELDTTFDGGVDKCFEESVFMLIFATANKKLTDYNNKGRKSVI